MGGKQYLYMFIFLCLTTFVYSEVLYSGQIYSYNSFDYNNNTYTIIGTRIMGDDMPNNYTEAYIQRPGLTGLTVKVGNCTVEGYYSYCFDKLNYDFNDPNTTKAQIQPKLLIRILHSDAGLTIARTLTASPKFGEPYTYIVSLKNGGINDIVVHYSETMPNSIQIVSSNNLTYTDNRVDRDFIVYKKSDYTFSYTLKNTFYDYKTWTAKYSYTYEGKEITESQNISLNTTMPFTITASIPKTNTQLIDEIVYYNIAIKNVDLLNNIDVTFNTLPINFVVSTGIEFKKNASRYVLNEQLSPGEIKNYRIELRAPKIGNYSISSIATIVAKDKTFKVNFEQNYTVTPPLPTVTLTADKKIINPDENLIVNITIKNPNKDESFYGFTGTLKSLEDNYATYAVLLPSETAIVNKTIRIRYTNESTINIRFVGSYKTKNQQEIGISATLNLPVNTSAMQLVAKDVVDDYLKEHETKNITTNSTTPQNVTVINPEKTQVENKPRDETSSEIEPVDERDFLTKLFDSINEFFSGIFG